MGGQLAINAVLAGTHYGFIALSFALVSRTAGFFHIAHGATYTVVAYVAMSLVGSGLGVVPAAAAGIGAGAVLGCAMDVVVFRPLRRQRASPEIHLLASFGLLIVLQNFISLIWGDARHVLWSRAAEPGLALLGGRVTTVQLAAVGLSLLCASGLVGWSRLTFAGLVLRAVGDSPELSRVRGVPTNFAILGSFAIASGAVGLAGILQASDTGLTPLMGFRALLVAFAGAVLGGLDNDVRAFVGGATIGIFEQVAAVYLPGQWYESVILAVLVLLLITRGRYLMSARER